MLRRRAVFAFPPNVTVIGKRDIGIERIALDRFHGVRVRFVTRSRHDAEVAVLRIDRIQAAIANLHPSDVVAHRCHFPAFEMFRRNKHGEIGFAACARECRRHVMFAAFGRFHPEDQHVLRHPALFAREIRSDPQSETFFAQQNVAAVTRPHRDDRVILRKMTDEPTRRINLEQ